MINIKITKVGKDPKDFQKNINAAWFEFQNAIMKLGIETTQDFKNNINPVRKATSTGNLAKNIELYDVKDMTGTNMARVGFGIGKIEQLNIHAPYWYWVNYGIAQSGTKTPGDGKTVPFGQFEPGDPKPSDSGFRSGRWQTSSVGEFGADHKSYRFKAQLDMPKMNYIENTLFVFGNKLQKLFSTMQKIANQHLKG